MPSLHRLVLVVACIATTVGCYDSTSVLDRDGSISMDGGADRDASAEDAFEPMRDAGPAPIDAHVPMPPADVVVCGGVVCATGQTCCLRTLRCTAPSDTCAVPPGTTDPDACASALDCDDDEICVSGDVDDYLRETGACGGGAGHCIDVPASDACPSSEQRVCACDGREYRNACEAARAGARIGAVYAACGASRENASHGCETDADCAGYLHQTGCGPVVPELGPTPRCALDDAVLACGIDAQCPAGQRCCAYSGACFDPARPASCAPIPEGTLFPCTDDTDCSRYDGSYWSHGSSSLHFCDGAGCGMSGSCRRVPTSCAGVIVPVCGCDGLTYQNECSAWQQRVRIAHEGSC